MTNANMAIITTDWHVTSNDSDAGGLGETYPTDALALARHINSLAPYLILNMGDDKDHNGDEAACGDELDQYKTNVYNVLDWPAPSGGNALKPMLPGNHDATLDSADAGANDYSVWTSRFWVAPFHWYIDWPSPKVRFIGIHSDILHSPDLLAGNFEIATEETTWLSDQLAALPVGYKAIICSHPPIDNVFFGNGIHATKGGTALLLVISTNAAKIAACLHGHRHLNGETHTLSGVLHMSCPSCAYTESNALGGFLILEYDGASSITIHYHTGHPGLLGAYGGFMPLVLSV